MSSHLQSNEQTAANALVSARYDAEMQQRIIALASQLQNQHQGTATAAELESIAAEVGVEPAFVRAAIAQLSGRSQVDTAYKPLHLPRYNFGFWNRNVTVWTKKDAQVLGGTLALAAFISSTDLANGGFLLPLALGVLLGPKRKIAWAGAAAIATEIAVGGVFHNLSAVLDWYTVGFSVFGAATGVLGAALRGLFSPLKNASLAPADVSTNHALP